MGNKRDYHDRVILTCAIVMAVATIIRLILEFLV